MSTVIAMAGGYEEVQAEHRSVDVPGRVAADWMEARRSGTLLVIRRVTYKAVPPEGETAHSGSPREVTEVDQIWINPHWVESIGPGHYPDASEEWRRQNDGSD